MGENDNLRLQEDIKTNMSVATPQQFAMTSEEMAFSIQQQVRGGGFNRMGRRKPEQQKMDTQEWVNATNTGGGNLQVGTAGDFRMAANWVHNVNQDIVAANQQNNRASSESIETIRENIKNSQESLNRKSCESLKIEECHIITERTSGSTEKVINNNASNNGRVNTNLESPRKGEPENNDNVTVEKISQDTSRRGSVISYQENSSNRQHSLESTDSLNESTSDLNRSYRSYIPLNDPYTDAIDLSNKCRQFYFTHQKAAEAMKQSVRSAKHTRAREKMEGKASSGIDNAMDRLRAEMADLMDQDLSLMSQLLKLNDKIEEVKTHVAYRHRQDSFSSQSSCNFSNSDMSDSELEDNDDSRLDLSHSPRNWITAQTAEIMADSQSEDEVVLNRLAPAESKVVKKKKPRKGRRRSSKSISKSETEVDTDESSGENETGSESLSDTESTLSYTSGTTINGSDQSDDGVEESSDNVDSGIQSGVQTPKPPEEPPVPKKGGISQNRKFLNFHKKNGNFTKSVITGLNVLTMQGHNVPLDKYFVPPGLVYLKQEKSENVFCQFTK